ncbi:hypothetical protein [Streptomyces sp. NPDC046909]|uniref:hypothetical protein n=1 Tax=Streptomyces sp. NPDC046909 TaxID=3155617 RepID=UPI0033DA8605
MARNVWARVAAAAVVSVLVAGCGGAEEEPAGTVSSSASASEAAASASVSGGGGLEPLTKAELTKALLEQGDLADYQVQDLAAPEAGAAPANTDGELCAAVASMLLFATSAEPVAVAGRTVSPTAGDSLGTGTSLVLQSYQEADAEQGMADLQASVVGCPDGFELSDDLKASAVKSLDAPDVGDEAVAFRLSGGVLGADTPTAYTVVRSGSTLAIFFAVNLIKPKTVAVPDEVVAAQIGKLEKVAG